MSHVIDVLDRQIFFVEESGIDLDDFSIYLSINNGKIESYVIKNGRLESPHNVPSAYVSADIDYGTEGDFVNNKNQESPIKTQLSIAKEAVEELNLRFQKAPEGASITSADGNTAIQKRNGTLVLSRSVKASRLKDIEAIGGMPMPSLAITKPELQDSLNCYGDITLIGDKGLAEKVIASGAVYDNDMVSPTIPRKRYKIDKPGINTLIRELNDMVPDEIRQTGTGVLQTLDNLREEDYLSANDLAWKFRNKIALTIAYVRENGIALPDYPVKHEARRYPEYLENKIQEYFDSKDKPVDISGLDTDGFLDYIKDELYRYIDEQGEKPRSFFSQGSTSTIPIHLIGGLLTKTKIC